MKFAHFVLVCLCAFALSNAQDGVILDSEVNELAAPLAYRLQRTYSGENFFNGFNFYTGNDPTNGYVNYVDYSTALNAGLISTANNRIYIGSDRTNVAHGRGRNSVRLESKDTYNSGLIIIDLTHMPTGCGTWPAFWTFGPNWPNGGEIDIIEGVDIQSANQGTLHTSQGCDMSSVGANTFTGRWATGQNGRPASNCWANAPGQYSNQGCGVIAPDGSYGAKLNAQGGGVFATDWLPSRGIRLWFFPRKSIPQDIVNGNPNPANWGLPYANFVLGPNCPANKFQNHKIIINLTFCGDWEGSVFPQNCPNKGTCQFFVQNNPQAFNEAYWNINYVKVFQNQ